jgi:exopolysaccharide biosynthesis WecB/TagA/CpsF family protein
MVEIALAINVFANSKDALTEINQIRLEDGVKTVSFVNAHACNLALKNIEFKDALVNSNLLLRDGIGARVLLRTFNIDAGFNANGTDFIPLIIDSLRNEDFVLIGSTRHTIDVISQMSKYQKLNIVGKLDGFNTFQTMLDFIKETSPSVVILGMGMPKQELFSEYLKVNYSEKLLIVNGGAIFDFITEQVIRAPRWMRKTGLEWLFRLIIEPQRLFNRYVIGIPVFLYKVAYAKFNN